MAMQHTSEYSIPITRWKLPKIPRNYQEVLSRELRLHPIISQILINRTIVDPEEARKYLSPSLGELHNPFLMKDMKKGVERLVKAIHDHSKVIIYGDYDADGITSVAILFKFLKKLNADVDYRIPDRTREGYSLNKPAIDEIKSRGIGLMITVDCGTSDYDHIEYARSIGLDTIILDHHEVPCNIPRALAVINTNRPDCPFPFKQLAGVGIVFNFLIALRGKLREEGFWTEQNYPNLKEYLDLVALGTIGDISPLVGENRIFAKIGIRLINDSPRIGVKALIDICGLNHQEIDSGTASFSLIPRINAAGRIASADEAVRLLLTEDSEEALILARRLDAYNRDRQTMERKILEEILEEIQSTQSLDNSRSLVLASSKWHPGVIGIVASRLVDMFSRPTILISLKNGIGKGSGRSISEFNLHQGLSKCQELLLAHGGHRYAAGISIKEENIGVFRVLLEEIISQEISVETLVPQTVIDAECSLNEIKCDLMSQLGLLAPFGSMNPEPILCARNVQFASPVVVGNKHLTMKICSDGMTCNSIWFGKAHLSRSIESCGANTGCSIAFTPQFNYWNGLSNLQLKLKDMMTTDSSQSPFF